MGKSNQRRKKGGSTDFSLTAISKYWAPMASYEDEVFKFVNQGAAKFDRTIHRLVRYLVTTSIKGITAYTPLLEAMEDTDLGGAGATGIDQTGHQRDKGCRGQRHNNNRGSSG